MKKLTLFAVILSLVVVVLGCYTRLKDAGLGCPDWPGCYGKIIAPVHKDDINTAEAKYPDSPYDTEKAWTEMVHRYVAGTLGILILFISTKFLLQRKNYESSITILSIVLVGMLIFQALLGMWTVTMRLYPVVVMGHLLGGLSILSILWWMNLRLNKQNLAIGGSGIKNIKALSFITLICLILQLALGGWTSSNYAALVCADFPSCQGSLWPNMDFYNAFNLFNAGIFDSPGTVLENPARVTIQMSHRIGALITTGFILLTCRKLFQQNNRVTTIIGSITIGLLALQITLGITNVLAGLPLTVAVLHNFIGALLLLAMLAVNFISYTSKIRNA